MVTKLNAPQYFPNPAVPEIVRVDFKGLYDYPNQFSPQSLPDGAVTTATNCVLERPGILDSRRGYGVYGNTNSNTANQALTLTTYAGGRLGHFDDNRIYVDNTAGQFAQLTATQYFVPGSYAGSRVRFVEMNQNLFFNTNTGIQKLQSLSATPILAGGPQALGGNVTSINLPANGGPLPNSAAVAYRALWEYTDQNNNLIRGVPSNPVIANNTSGSNSANVTLSWTVPTTVDTTWTFRVYRSNYGNQIPPIPDDNCQLVYSIQPNAAQISARTISFTDNVADTARGETLYTTSQGSANAEYRPPIAQDLGLYKGSMFYGNCKTYQQLLLTLQNEGLQAGDNLTFWVGATAKFAVFAGASENASINQFKVFTGSTAAIDIDATAQSLANVINYAANNTILDAYYQGFLGVSQGGLLFQERSYSDTPFYVTCSNTASQFFSPNLPASGNNINNLSTDTNFQNRLYFSKSLQPEAVPLNFFLAVGSQLTGIKRVLPGRDVLFIIKDDGVYAVVGNDPTTFTVYPLDIQQNLVGVNTPVVLNNILYFIAQQGAIAMQQDGTHKIISLPIQQTLMQYTTNVYPNFASASWAMPYQASHKYILFTVANPADTTAQQAFVFDYTTDAWTNWSKPFTAGVVDPVLGTMWATNFVTGNVNIYQERKNLAASDYCDEQYAITLTAQNGLVLNVSSIPVQAVVGDSVFQNPYISVITALNTNVAGNAQITVTDSLTWNVASVGANICTPIPVTIVTSPIFGNDPTVMKQFPEYSVIVGGTSEAAFTVSFFTDNNALGGPQNLTVPVTVGAYGTTPFGIGPFGSGSLNNPGYRLRNFVPGNVQKCNWLTLSFNSDTAFNKVAFSGLQLQYRLLSARQRT